MKYITNFSRGCFCHWSISKAIAEIVSNFLDSDGERDYSFGEDYIELTNTGIKLSNKVLMMGLSDKRDDSSKRGTFGCGLPQSMVVLTDLGINVTIKNNDVQWIPSWEYCDKFETDIMVINESPCDNGSNFTVLIEGLSETDIDEVKQRCLVFQDREVLYSTEYGDIIDNSSGEGEVFCGDMYVCQNSSFKYSYNFKPKGIKLSQDRDAVDQWGMSELTAKLIIATGDDEFIKQAIKSNGVDTDRLNSSYFCDSSRKTPSTVNDKFAEEFLEEYGAVPVTTNYTEHTRNLKIGNKSVYVSNSVQCAAITNSDLYKEAIMSVEIIERESFKDLLLKTLDLMEELLHNNGLIDYSEQNTDKPRTGNNEVVDWLDEIKERVSEGDYS